MNDRHAHAIIGALLAILAAIKGWDFAMYVSWSGAIVFWIASTFRMERTR